MKAREFLEIATELAGRTPPSPAGCRTAISRSYYAAYNELAELFSGFGVSLTKGPECHREVESLLNSTGNENLTRISAKYHQLKDMRRQSDYELNNKSVESKSDALLYIKISNSLISAVDSLRSNNADFRQTRAKVLEVAPKLRINIKTSGS